MEHFPLIDRLHTDVLEERYGPIHAEILEHTDKRRLAHLKDENGVSRTFAITLFPEEGVDERLEAIDAEIRSGEAIGKAFRKHQFSIRKNVIDVYTIQISEKLQESFGITEAFAKARLSEFLAKKRGEEPIIYGTVVEIYSPDFRPAIINTVDISQINPTLDALMSIGYEPEIIWKSIGDGSQWAQQESFPQARKQSLPYVFSCKKAIRDVLDGI